MIDKKKYLTSSDKDKLRLVADEYGLTKEAGHFWFHDKSGKWVLAHKAVEIIAAQEGIKVAYEVVCMDPKFVVIKATPYRSGEAGQETFGEASPGNTTQKHPVAMTEKRAYDRAVLKNAFSHFGGYGDFYSEEEDEDFKATSGQGKATQEKAKAGYTFEQAKTALKACGDKGNLAMIKKSMKSMDISEPEKDVLRDLYLAAQDRVNNSEST